MLLTRPARAIATTFGKLLWLAAHLVPFQFESETRLLAVITDITGRKEKATEPPGSASDRMRGAEGKAQVLPVPPRHHFSGKL